MEAIVRAVLAGQEGLLFLPATAGTGAITSGARVVTIAARVVTIAAAVLVVITRALSVEARVFVTGFRSSVIEAGVLMAGSEVVAGTVINTFGVAGVVAAGLIVVALEIVGVAVEAIILIAGTATVAKKAGVPDIETGALAVEMTVLAV